METTFQSWLERLPQLKIALLEHLLLLTLLPVALAAAIAIPLAVAVRHLPVLRSITVGACGVVQTIPSLAMLAFLLPLFGIGKLPAIIALTLYAILPILQNTVTALRDLPAGVLEAADGMGYSSRQRLFLVELPLARPLIVSGLRTATVICVGVATLSTFIGAGGLGDFINRGLALNRMSLLLTGAVAAAALALILDFFLDTAGIALHPGRKPASLTRRVATCGVLLFLLTAAALIPAGGRLRSPSELDAGVVRIGSKNFSEQLLLGELLAQWIEAETGLQADRRFNLGGTVICHQALTAGEIDLYVEYSGTAFLTLLGREYQPGMTPEAILRDIRTKYTNQFDCNIFPPLGFENTYAITVRRAMADEYGWRSISELAEKAATLRGGFTSEFMERPDGLPGLKRAYGLHFASVSDLSPELMYPAAAQGDVDVIGAFSTDGRILEFDLQTLEDDRGFFPPYQAVPVARHEILKQFPELETALRRLSGILDTATMTRLNHEVDVEKKSPREVVRRFLQETFYKRKPTQD